MERAKVRRIETREVEQAASGESAGARTMRAQDLLGVLRVHQWAKNFLVFVPLLLAHKFKDLQAWERGLLCFLSFSLAASGVYVLNDLCDLASDRAHPRKKLRPFAAGRVAPQVGYALLPILFAAALGLALVLRSPSFAVAVGIYIVAGGLYSIRLRGKLIVDIFVLAGLYTLRVLAGGLGTHIPVTQWLLAFAMFLFLSLAFLKRYSDIRLLAGQGAAVGGDHAYFRDDAALMRSMGTASGYLSVLVLALYLNSSEVLVLYHRPQLLWIVCVLLLYWITRIWFVGHRGEIEDDPLMFTLKDPVSYAVGAGVALAVLLAI
jgi:4-hydroxybenzoate polyprenyltransferase